MLVRAMCVYTRWLFGLTDEWCHIAVPAWILVISPGFFASYPLVNIRVDEVFIKHEQLSWRLFSERDDREILYDFGGWAQPSAMTIW